MLSLLFGVIATALYIPIALWFSTAFEQPLLLLLVMAPQVLLSYIKTALVSTARGYAPQYNGYGLILFELVKVVIAVVLVYFFRVGLLGAMVSVVIAQAASVLFLFMLNYRVICESIVDYTLAKTWLRYSFLPVFSASIGFVLKLDVLLVRLITGNELPIAYYGVALSLAGVVSTANVIAAALYPRLLAKASKADATITLKLIYMVAIPLSIFMFFYVEPITAIFGVKYLIAIDTIKVATIASLLFIFSPFLDTIIIGSESSDVDVLTFKDLIRSMLFKLPVINFIISIVHLVLLYLLQVNMQSYSDASFRWIVGITVTNLLRTTVKLFVLRKNVPIDVGGALRAICHFAGISLVVTFIARTLWAVQPVERIFTQVLDLFPPTVFVLVGYFAVLYLLNADFKQLVTRIRTSYGLTRPRR
jgi:hypothetical protein